MAILRVREETPTQVLVLFGWWCILDLDNNRRQAPQGLKVGCLEVTRGMKVEKLDLAETFGVGRVFFCLSAKAHPLDGSSRKRHGMLLPRGFYDWQEELWQTCATSLCLLVTLFTR